MAAPSGDFEVFETFDDDVVVFVGTWGAQGVLVHRGGAEWIFFAAESIEWDGFHQAIFRNHRGLRLTVEDLARRGIALPPLDEYRGRPPGNREERFPSTMPARKAPRGLRARLESGPLTVYLVLFEDRYETAFGDGKFLYPEAAFADRAEADGWVQRTVAARTDPAEHEWHEYTVKPIVLRLDRERGTVVADSAGRYEHYGVHDVVTRLAGPKT